MFLKERSLADFNKSSLFLFYKSLKPFLPRIWRARTAFIFPKKGATRSITFVATVGIAVPTAKSKVCGIFFAKRAVTSF